MTAVVGDVTLGVLDPATMTRGTLTVSRERRSDGPSAGQSFGATVDVSMKEALDDGRPRTLEARFSGVKSTTWRDRPGNATPLPLPGLEGAALHGTQLFTKDQAVKTATGASAPRELAGAWQDVLAGLVQARAVSAGGLPPDCEGTARLARIDGSFPEQVAHVEVSFSVARASGPQSIKLEGCCRYALEVTSSRVTSLTIDTIETITAAEKVERKQVSSYEATWRWQASR